MNSEVDLRGLSIPGPNAHAKLPGVPEAIRDSPRFSPEFSLVLGGLLQRLWNWARLTDADLHRVGPRVVVTVLVAWLPLLVLASLEGELLGGAAVVPFLLDVEVHVRFLVALPLLLMAEPLVHRRMQPMMQQFLDRNLIPDRDITRFRSIVASAHRLRDSVLAELLLIGLVYGVGIIVIWRGYIALDTVTWYAAPSADNARLSRAGLWYGYVSLPIFQFLLCRWYFRFFIWARLLWQISRIDLCLVPTHPDRVGGLGFLGGAAEAFAIVAVAHGAILAGQVANRIFFLGATLPQFKIEIGAMVAVVLFVILGPLLAFATQLAQSKRDALREYGILAQGYVRAFDTKWLRGGAPAGEPFVGSGDIQSLADLGTSYEAIKDMRLAPITKSTVVLLSGLTLAPLVPLLLTMMPLEQLVKTLLGLLF